MKTSMRLRVVLSAGFLSMVLQGSGLAATSLPPIHRGFNTFPWMYRSPTIGGDPRRFDFAHAFPYLDRFTAADFQALHKAGVDVIRVPLEPSALVAADPATRATLFKTVLKATRRVTGLGMTAILDLHPHEGVKGWGAADILHDPALLDAYRAMTVDLAAAMAASGDARLVLELMNEPPGGWGGSEGVYWIKIQPDLVKAVRAVAPTLPIVVEGDRSGGIDGLLRIDPRAFDDPRIIYSFHYYEPMLVTHQGTGWTSRRSRHYIANLPYPAKPGGDGSEVAAFRDRVLSDPAMPAEARTETLREGTSALQDYLRHAPGPTAIRDDFARVTAWAARYNIPANRIILGEFGVFRPAASEATVANYAAAVRSAAEADGFGWIYFNYAPFDENGAGFSVLQMQGPTPTAFDPLIMQKGLGLTPP